MAVPHQSVDMSWQEVRKKRKARMHSPTSGSPRGRNTSPQPINSPVFYVEEK